MDKKFFDKVGHVWDHLLFLNGIKKWDDLQKKSSFYTRRKKCPFKSFEDVFIYSYSPFEKYKFSWRLHCYLPQRQKSKILICFRLFLRDRSLLWAFIPTKKIILTFKTVNTVWLLPLKLHHFFGISASVSPIIFDQTISKPVRRSKKVFIVAKYVTSLRFSYLQNKNKTSEINGKSIVHTKLGNNENFHP